MYKSGNKIFSSLGILLILLNVVSPFLSANIAYAQEASSSAETAITPTPAVETLATPQPSEEPVLLPEITSMATVTASPIPTITPSSVSEPSATVTPNPTPIPSVWKNGENNSFETIENVKLGMEYSAPQNNKVKILFTKLPEKSGALTVKEITLTSAQVQQLQAASDTAYEITSSMTDGTFVYDLTLPLPKQAKGKTLEVKSAETTGELQKAQTVTESKEEKEDVITIKSLNHFTVFVITTPNPDTTQRVLINEVLPNPTAGTEWIELFNNGTTPVNLAAGTGWVINNSVNNSQSLSALGTIDAAGRVVFETPAGWLSNTASETVTLSNELGSTVDTITISLSSPGFAIDHYPLINESVGRKTDGVSEWKIFTAPTKGTANAISTPATGLIETGPIAPAGGLMAGFPSWYKDSNGFALDLMEAADAFGISDPVDPANPFSQTVGFNAEGFWWSAEASIDRPIGTRVILVLALEAAFAGEAAVDGEQSVQNRVRYRIDGLVPGETYTITHPFGDADEVADVDGVINVTDDIGCFAEVGVTCDQTASPNFSTALLGQVGPYLTWTTFHTNPALTDPQLVNPVNPGRRYVGNPAFDHAVTGSPIGNNFFRVEGLNVGGPGVNSIETNLFSVSGRLADTTAPVITLFGANPVNVNQGAVYTDAGATALDDLGGNLSGSIQVSGLPVNTTTLGVKTITYTVTDSVGRTSVATRTVNIVESPVVDTTAPVITILGANPASVVAGTPYVDAGATALDNVDGSLTANIVTTGLPIDTSAVGQFTVTYNVSDAAGNAALQAVRTVNVIADTIPPVITLLGSNPVNVLTGAPYNDAGATAIDNVGGDITATIDVAGLPIDTSAAGTFTITYTVADAAGNTAVRTRTVIIADTLPAGIVETGPIAPAGGLMAGFPSWYKDSNGFALDLMEAADAFGISDPVDPANPFSQTVGFNAEGFWWSAEASPADTVNTITGTPVSGILVLALEAVFAGEAAVDGEQSAQNRLRYRIAGLVPGATYTIHHPFGNVDEVADGDGVINVTDDVGCFDTGVDVTCDQTASPNFSTVFGGKVGPYLTWTTFHTNPALTDPQLVNPVNPGRRYVGNPAFDHAVTGSPIGQNSFSVTGPGLSNFTTNLFSVSGRLADTTAPVITILGDNPAQVVQNTPYVDAGATALDDFDGNITANIRTTGLPVDTSTLGVKTVTYTVSDRAGNTTTVTRTVNVITLPDVTAPTGLISINNNAVYTITRSVTLNFTGVSPDVTQMQLRNGTTGGFQTAIPFEANHPYTLLDTQGTLAVSVRFIDFAGNISQGIISDSIIFDSIAPNNPTDVRSSSHTENTASSDNTIDMIWSPTTSGNGASDATSGVAGFSHSFTQGATDSPSATQTLDSATIGISSAALNNGTWFFHLRTIDNAGNWSSAFHIGPFIINANPPVTSDNTDNNWHNNDVTITLTCTPALGFTCVDAFYTTDGSTPTTASSKGNAIVFNIDGIYTLKYFSVDSDQQIESVKTAANQVKLDKTNPANAVPSSSTHSISTWSNNPSVTIDWSGASDNLSGVAGYYTEWNTSSNTISGTVNPEHAPSVLSETTALSDGNSHFFHIVTIDNAGNISNIAHFGPFLIDTQAPSITGLSNDEVSKQSKTWNWDSSDPTALFRFVIDQDPNGVPSGIYSSVKSATQNTGSGTFYIHVQARDAAGNESAVMTVSAILNNQKGNITIIKNVLPQSAQDFEFNRSSGGGNFFLDDDSDPTLLNEVTFGELSANTYVFSEVNIPNSWILTNINCVDPDNGTTTDIQNAQATIDLDPGENITCTFQNSIKPQIAGSVFEDVSGNGVKDPSDPALSGRTVYLDANNNGVLDSGEISSTTDSNGAYQFVNLTAGEYRVRTAPNPGWTQTLPANAYVLNAQNGQVLQNNDFGFFRSVTISGSVWRDSNGNRLRETAEVGIEGWEITLNQIVSSVLIVPLSTATSSSTGAFNFTAPNPGQYRIVPTTRSEWQQTYPASSFFDVFVNVSGFDIAVDSNGNTLQFGFVPVFSISGNGQFISINGIGGISSSVTSMGDSTLTGEGNGGTNTITIPNGTTIARTDGLDFDSSLLSLSIPQLTIISGLGSNQQAVGLLQWGIPQVGLLFSNPITLQMFVGSSLNGQTLSIMRSISSDSGWTNDGIVAPATCVVTNGICSFQATKASYYAALKTQTPPATGSSSDGGSSSNGGTASPYVCNDAKPESAPTLLSAENIGNNQVRLTWRGAKDPVTYYLVAFGTAKGVMQFGNPNIGDRNTTSYVVNNLSAGTTYYFRIRAGNGCKPGDFSNELSAQASGETFINTIPDGFSDGVLGTKTDKEEDKKKQTNESEEIVKENKEVKGDKKTAAAKAFSSFIWPIAAIILLAAGYAGVQFYLRKSPKTNASKLPKKK